ncbi:MAG TPA: NADH-quinone oxidoreductase subunit NuoH [Phycisphaerae bacterium]|nr:NADH-quinone oxidoreductase subunit NuoH [Phycisphaerae bacterium]
MAGVFIAHLIFALVIFNVLLGLIAYLILLERKTAAWMQDRLGPNRVGPHGLMQPLADGVKFILKEEFMPTNADPFLFILAPIVIITPALCGFAVIPWGGQLLAGTAIPHWIPFIGGWAFPRNFDVMVANPQIGALFILAVASLSVYGVVLGGWASGSKYSFLGGMRAAAQMISYEIPLVLSLLSVAVVAGTLRLGPMVTDQASYFDTFRFIPAWNVFVQPLAFIIFTICIFAEANRTPFDLAECESELVGGYHTEYSSMKFAMFFLAEYSAMITGSAAAVALFLGGWHLPWIDQILYAGPQPVATGWLGALLKFVVFAGKILAFIFFYMWVRWTLPRFRFDQLMNLAWRSLIPLSLGTFVLAAVFEYMKQSGIVENRWWLLLGNLVLLAAGIGAGYLLPADPTNRRLPVLFSRYNPTPIAEKAEQNADAANIYA